MLRSIIRSEGEFFPHDPALRGYSVVYRENEVNHCPGCGRTHWFVGRTTAECGFCQTALPLAEAGMIGAGMHSHSKPTWQRVH